MRRYRLRIIKCIILAIILFCVFYVPFGFSAKEIVFSHESGFYDAPFYLELREGKYPVHYTLDASEPTIDSPIYTDPIFISDNARENIYCLIDDVYLGFNDKLEELGIVVPDIDPRKKPNQEQVDKAVIVKAACFDDDGCIISSNKAVYFIGYKAKEEYEGVNIISIIMDPTDLFDYDKGIYITGKRYDEYLYSLTDLSYFNMGNAWANYKEKGAINRRPADIYFFDSDKSLMERGTYDVAVQGGMTRSDIPRSLNIYETEDSFLNGIKLGFGSDVGGLNLFSGGNDRYTKLIDVVINKRTSEFNFATRTYLPYELFLEGEYWGTYYLTERFDKTYFQEKYGINGNDAVMIKRKSVELGTKEDLNDWFEVVDYISSNDMSDIKYYEQACDMIDMNSCIDYYATEIYIANTDWPGNNVGVWKSRSKSGRTLYDDGKWRWVLYDVNSSVDIQNARVDGIDRTMKSDTMFLSLLDNYDFNSKLKEKLVLLARNTFNPEEMRTEINKEHDKMFMAMANDYLRFYGDKNITDYSDACNEIIRFFEIRAEYILSLYGSKE